MPYKVIITLEALRQAKRLTKKYVSFKGDLMDLVEQLALDPLKGISLGKDLYKVRLAIRSKSKGRSGGARVITCVKVVRQTVYIAYLYDKTDRSTLTDAELKRIASLFSAH